MLRHQAEARCDPILDLKPYLSSIPPENLRRGWIAEAEARRQNDYIS